MVAISIQEARARSGLVTHAIAIDGAAIELCDYPEVRSETVTITEVDSVLMLGLSRLMTGSQGRLADDPRRRFARFGTLAFRPAGVPMEFEVAGGAFQTLRIRFAESRAAAAFGSEQLSDAALASCFDIHSRPIESAMMRLAEEVEHPMPDTPELAKSLVNTILIDLARYLTASHAVARRPLGGLSAHDLRVVTEMMNRGDANPGDEPSIDKLAAACELSRNHFIRCFRQSTGVGPATWMRRKRIDRAKAQLAENKLGLASIAQQAGYRALPAFSAAFRREVGLSPTAWQARMR